MNYTAIGFTILFAALYYSAGEIEARSGAPNHGVLWAALSIVVSLIVLAGIGGGIVALIVCQALLLIGIAVVRVILD